MVNEKILKNISDQVFFSTGEKLDPHSMAVIAGIVAANNLTNEELKKSVAESIETNKRLAEKIKGSINITNTADSFPNISPPSALMLRSGWGAWVVLALSIIFSAYKFYEYQSLEAVILLNKQNQQIEYYRLTNPKTANKYFPKELNTFNKYWNRIKQQF